MTHLYHSGTPANHKYQRAENGLCSHRLFSLHGNYLPAVLKWLANTKEEGGAYPRCIMLDSGAFTAWNKGEESHLEAVIAAYDAFVEKADGMFDEVWGVNLDKIPGQAGRDPTQEEIAQALVESDKNFEVLNARFPRMILPVFHQGESWGRLDEVKAQAEYVCLSPRNDLHEALRVNWSRELHARNPGIMSHGLAATGVKMMRNVPWYSTDSAAWRLRAAYGLVILDVGHAYRSIFVSDDAGKNKLWDMHIDTVAPAIKDALVARMESYGFTLEQAKKESHVRALISMGEMSRFTARAHAAPPLAQGGLFDD